MEAGFEVQKGVAVLGEWGWWPRAMRLAVAVGVTVAGLSGCGSTGGSSSGGGSAGAVAVVAGNPISKASLEHWMRVESVLGYAVIIKQPAPTGVLPDPPSYSACITWLGSSRGPLDARSLSVAQRKSRCQQRLENLKKKTLGFLMSYLWYQGEAKDQGIKVSESEVQRNFRRFQREELPGKEDLQHYLSYSGMSLADATLIQRLGTLGDKIHSELFGKGSEAQVRQAFALFTSKWVAKTSCNPGYIVPGCKQYHGPQPPP